MRIETVATREVASPCAIEVAVGLDWLMDQVDGWVWGWKARRDSGVTLEDSAGAEIKVIAAKMGWCGYL
jgi:hypothetical protein